MPLLLCLLLAACLTSCYSREPREFTRMEEYSTTKKYPGKVADESIAIWHKKVPEVREVNITSTADGKQEPALFYNSDSYRMKPLLVVLHSWSSEYLQVVSIPYALWAKKYDWVFIQPNYRGKFDDPEAMASDLAVQDIVDAVEYAKKHADIDTSRIYLVGSSGGAMTALVTTSKHPNIWAGVVAWVPIFDLVDWYAFSQYYPHRDYNRHIVTACGGEPLPGTPAAEEAKRRSPSTYLSNAKGVPIFLAHGTIDVLVPPDHSMRAFNVLANPEDRFTQEEMDYVVKEQKIPPAMEGPREDSLYFGGNDPKVLFRRESDKVRLVLYEGVHDMAYNPSLLWLSQQQKQPPVQQQHVRR